MLLEKTKAIIRKCMAQFATKQVLNDMKWACFSSVMTDSSNYLNLRLVPLLIRCYHTEEGVIVKAFNLVSLGGETSDQFKQKPDCYDDVIRVFCRQREYQFWRYKKERKGIIFTTNCMNIQPTVRLIFSQS